ncbi:hypothetical protein LO771_17005 [Streptacidiphilus sp. ASG 303]|uniref:hypothetical protein n=1 Tax=Streptacidiphilus sp. ASG 303 TaxID=2896847 RepID=UPI001E33B442|nr:hypothetical protein [Streptacidiphilus sp. ASG 303]MCD0484044.1 hypothetical protein [Streptacidiphilus sp. ASG 303]
MEEAAAELGTVVLLRHGVLYGPDTWYAPGVPVVATLAGAPAVDLPGSVEANDAVTSFLHVSDAARAAVAALGRPAGPVNVVDDEPSPSRARLPVLAQAVGALPRRSPQAARAGSAARSTPWPVLAAGVRTVRPG